jgi:hypothetical protein
MRCRGIGLRTILVAAVVAAALAAPKLVFAQAGVVVDAEGVLSLKARADLGNQLGKQHAAAARNVPGAKAASHSSLRKVSLNRLEQAIRDHQKAVTDEMRCLAGLLRVRYVFFYPDSGDIVLAGPAEAWTADAVGRMVGVQSGRPVVQLADLCVALRCFPPGGEPTRLIGCSIDPTPEGLDAMQRFLRSVGSTATPSDTQYIVHGLQTNLGLQTISWSRPTTA